MGNCLNQDNKLQDSALKTSLSIKLPKAKQETQINSTEPVEEVKINITSQKYDDDTCVQKNQKKTDLMTSQQSQQNSQKKPVGLDDFLMLNLVGKGAFGKVFRVKKQDTGKIYAMKQIQKKQIVDHKLESNTVLERNVLKTSKHPFIVQLKFSFQTHARLYFVMEYVSGGEFYKILQQTEVLPENVVKFVAAEVVLALEYLNTKLKVIYRDLKPENILLSDSGHVKLTDFGLATIKKENGEMTYTLAGTPEYLAPEIITRQGHSYEVDLWTLGILIYEMLSGYAPFNHPDRNVQKIQELILINKVQYPLQMSSEAKDLIGKLLKTNPKERLGVNGYHELKAHSFFAQIQWEEMLELKIKSPLKQYAEIHSVKVKQRNHVGKPMSESPTNNSGFHFAGITYQPEIIDQTLPNSKLESN